MCLILVILKHSLCQTTIMKATLCKILQNEIVSSDLHVQRFYTKWGIISQWLAVICPSFFFKCISKRIMLKISLNSIFVTIILRFRSSVSELSCNLSHPSLQSNAVWLWAHTFPTYLWDLPHESLGSTALHWTDEQDDVTGFLFDLLHNDVGTIIRQKGEENSFS